MSSITVQSGLRNTFTCPSFAPQSSPLFKPLNPTVVALKQMTFSSSSSTKCSRPIKRFQVLSSSATAEAAVVEEDALVVATDEEEELYPVIPTQKAAEAVGKPRIVLKFVWMEKNIGLALDQVLPGHGTVPLSPYFFWPRKDAWEELKTTLESKPWITQKKMIILLNQATDIINLWQQSGGNLPSSSS